MKSKKVIAALCALAAVVSSSGGLPFSGVRLFDTAVTASAENSNEGWTDCFPETGDYVLVCSTDRTKVLTYDYGYKYSTYTGSDNQKWHFERVSGKPYYKIAFGNRAMDVPMWDEDMAYGNNLSTVSISSYGTFSEYETNVFRFSQRAGGPSGDEYAIRVVSEAKNKWDYVLQGNPSGNGVKIQAFDANNSNQYWSFIPFDDYHEHSWSYNANGSTITASCTDGCEITDGLTITISAPTDLKANGSPKEATLSTGYNTTAFPDTYTIEYYKGEDKLDGAPSAGGHYTAKVTVGEATASVDFTIVVDPTYTITIPESVNIDGGSAEFKAENVTLPDGAKINITVDGENTEAGAATFNAKNESGNSTVSYTINNGSADVFDGGTAMTFTGNGTQTLTFAKKADSTPTYAGAHTETLTFGVKLEDPNAPKI